MKSRPTCDLSGEETFELQLRHLLKQSCDCYVPYELLYGAISFDNIGAMLLGQSAVGD